MVGLLWERSILAISRSGSQWVGERQHDLDLYIYIIDAMEKTDDGQKTLMDSFLTVVREYGGNGDSSEQF